MKAILATAICLCLYITAQAGDTFRHKGILMHGAVHHVNAQEGWATVHAAEYDGKHFKVWLKDLDTATRVRIGVATPAEALELAQAQAIEQAAAQAQAEQDRADLARQQAAQTARSAQQAAERQAAAQLEVQRQALELQRRQTEAMEQAVFLRFLRSQQR